MYKDYSVLGKPSVHGGAESQPSPANAHDALRRLSQQLRQNAFPGPNVPGPQYGIVGIDHADYGTFWSDMRGQMSLKEDSQVNRLIRDLDTHFQKNHSDDDLRGSFGILELSDARDSLWSRLQQLAEAPVTRPSPSVVSVGNLRPAPR